MTSLRDAALVLAGAMLLTRAFLRVALRWPPGGAQRWHRQNYRDREVSLLGGIAGVGGLAVALALLVTLANARWVRETWVTLAVVLAVGALGLLDDMSATSHARGLRGHLRMLRARRVTTGTVKLVGIIAAAAASSLLLRRPGAPAHRLLVDVVLVAGCANLANLLDLRPGRALKVIAVAGVALLAAARDEARTLGAAILGVVIGLLPADLRERTMLGDTGANALGAASGVAATLVLGDRAAVAAALAVVILNLSSERVSFSSVIERTPALRWADRVGMQEKAPRR